jgi:hypothetical protein
MEVIKRCLLIIDYKLLLSINYYKKLLDILNMKTFWEISFSGLFVIVGTWLSYWQQKKMEKDKEQKQIKSFLKSIKYELSGIWDRYYETIGEEISKLTEEIGLNYSYIMSENYFVVYDNNTNMLGNLNSDLSEKIVKTYMSVKGLKDTLIGNNQILENLKKYQLLHDKKLLKDFGKNLKETHNLFKTNFDDLIKSIDREINS